MAAAMLVVVVVMAVAIEAVVVVVMMVMVVVVHPFVLFAYFQVRQTNHFDAGNVSERTQWLDTFLLRELLDVSRVRVPGRHCRVWNLQRGIYSRCANSGTIIWGKIRVNIYRRKHIRVEWNFALFRSKIFRKRVNARHRVRFEIISPEV